jgi:hypothetical protein
MESSGELKVSKCNVTFDGEALLSFLFVFSISKEAKADPSKKEECLIETCFFGVCVAVECAGPLKQEDGGKVEVDEDSVVTFSRGVRSVP